MANSPNVVLLVVDCLRSDRILGQNRTCKTPNIDRLVESGTSLPNVFVENSITAPSFTSIFTGRYTGNHGVIGMVGVRLDDNAVTMAEIFSANGYETYAEVTGPLNPLLGIDRGFAHYNYRSQQDYCFTEWGDNLLKKLKNNELEEPYFLLVHFWDVHVPRQVPHEFDSPEFGETEYDRSVSALDSYIGKIMESLDDDTLLILTGDHGEAVGELPADQTLLPYFLNKLNLPPVDAEAPETIDDVVELMQGNSLIHDFASDLTRLTGSDEKLGLWKRIKMMFDLLRIGMARYRIQMKNGIKGSFVSNIKQKIDDMKIFLAVARGNPDAAQLQLVRNSLSEHSLQHGYHIYDYLQQVPVVLNKKGLFRKGKRVETDLRQIDLLPTLIDALQLQAPDDAGFDGSSYLPDINNGGGENRPIYMEARGGAQAEKVFLVRGVRRDGKKVAFAPFEKKAPVEHYDLANDPTEQKNLAPDSPQITEDMQKEADAIASTLNRGLGQKLSAKDNLEMVKRLKSLGYM
jgi:arylsulfatase A-like enzyme